MLAFSGYSTSSQRCEIIGFWSSRKNLRRGFKPQGLRKAEMIIIRTKSVWQWSKGLRDGSNVGADVWVVDALRVYGNESWIAPR